MTHITTARELRVFLALLAHADKDGRCYPSLETIVQITGLDERDARRTLRALEKIGAIQTEHRKGRSPSRYRVMPPPNAHQNEGGDLTPSQATPPQRQGGDLTPSQGGDLPPSQGGDLPPLSNHVSVPFKKPTSSRARATDDDEKTTTDDESRTTVPNAEKVAANGKPPKPLREPTEGEREVLEICLAWLQGERIPMAPHLVELYRTMRPVHDLPIRPGT